MPHPLGRRAALLSLAPPVYPGLVETAPSRLRSSSSTPQKHPPARMAVSVVSFIVVSLSLRDSGQ